MAKEIKHYDFSRKPLKPSGLWMWAARTFAIAPRLKGRTVTVKKINMDAIKPPYLLFVTHASMLDFPAMYTAVAPYNANNVVAIDAIRDVGDFIMRRLGCIGKRKFVKDYHLIKHMRYCADKLKSIVCVYPEARYSLDGTTGFLPDSLGKTGKILNIPVVVLRLYGTFITAPQWNKDEQYIPLKCELECVANQEEIMSLSADEVNRRIHVAMQRDDYAYQRAEKIELTNPDRANGLHNILYQCPHCGKEFMMHSSGSQLWCEACGKSWQMSTLSVLTAQTGETEFSYIPDWVAWERENVRREVRDGTYRFEADVTVHTLPNAKRFYDQGMGHLVQTCEGTRLTCTAYKEERDLFWEGAELESTHIEYDYTYSKEKYKKNIFGDCVDISTREDSYWLHPVGLRDQLTKLSLATEEIFLLSKEKIKERGDASHDL